jgi:hypothetical protein
MSVIKNLIYSQIRKKMQSYQKNTDIIGGTILISYDTNKFKLYLSGSQDGKEFKNVFHSENNLNDLSAIHDMLIESIKKRLPSLGNLDKLLLNIDLEDKNTNATIFTNNNNNKQSIEIPKIF